MSHGDETALAIIGLGGRFPGASSIDEFWNNLAQGIESIRFFTRDELLAAGVRENDLDDPAYVKAKGVLEGADRFDARFFGYTPQDAAMMDPQHRIFLETAWEVLESAGHGGGVYPGRIGVFAGCRTLPPTYLMHALESNPELFEVFGMHRLAISTSPDFLASKVAYRLNLRGPALTVQTACSTSLVAVHLACQSLLIGESDMAIAGGASVSYPFETGYLFTPGGIRSSDGHCRPFDAAASGTVGGDGVGAVLLKRLPDALRDGDSVRAIILASAINNDGAAKVGFTAPSIDGQITVIRDAHDLAGIDATSIGYLEAHGTGTSLGDPIEAAALTRAFHAGGASEPGTCALGSVKANIGHLDAAAGIAGLIKLVLALEHRQIPPTPNFEKPNPELKLDETPFYVNTRLVDWRSEHGHPRRAGLTALGLGGTNVHMVLEEAPPAPPAPAGETVGPSRRAELILLSAADDTALEASARNLALQLEADPELELADCAYTLSAGRKRFPHRMAVVADTVNLAASALGSEHPASLVGTDTSQGRPVAFLLPGGGAQYPGMGRGLYELEPVYRAAIDSCAGRFRTSLDADIRRVMYPSAAELDGARTAMLRPSLGLASLFATEYALATLLIHWGIRPCALIGHSSGEYAGACLAGELSLEEAITLVARRGQLFEQIPAGSMLGVRLSADALGALLPRDVSIAAINGESFCAVSGATAAIAELEAELTRRGVESQRVAIHVAAHSPLVDPILEPFAAIVSRFRPVVPKIPRVSNVTGSWITSEDVTDERYWVRHLRQTVRFSEGLATLLENTEAILLEVGPGHTLSTLARKHPKLGAHRCVVHSLPHPQDPEPDRAFVLRTLGQLWIAGAAIDWTQFWSGQYRRRVRLPTYPFQRQRYRIEGSSASSTLGAAAAAFEPTGSRVSTSRRVAPETETERAIARLFEEALGVPQIGAFDNFFALGGDSLIAVQLVARIGRTLGVPLEPSLLLRAQTVHAFAHAIGERKPAATTSRRSCVVELQRGRARTPFFLAHPAGGGVYHYRQLANALGSDFWICGLEAAELDAAAATDRSIEEMARHYLDEIRSLEPSGPYALGGSSFGGAIAYELAQRLHEQGEKVSLLALFDTPGVEDLSASIFDDLPRQLAALARAQGLSIEASDLEGLSPDAQYALFVERAEARAGRSMSIRQERQLATETIRTVHAVFLSNVRALCRYRPRPYSGRLTYFRARERRPGEVQCPERAWIELAEGGIEIETVPGSHMTMHQEPHVQALANKLRARVRTASF